MSTGLFSRFHRTMFPCFPESHLSQGAWPLPPSSKPAVSHLSKFPWSHLSQKDSPILNCSWVGSTCSPSHSQSQVPHLPITWENFLLSWLHKFSQWGSEYVWQPLCCLPQAGSKVNSHYLCYHQKKTIIILFKFDFIISFKNMKSM